MRIGYRLGLAVAVVQARADRFPRGLPLRTTSRVDVLPDVDHELDPLEARRALDRAHFFFSGFFSGGAVGGLETYDRRIACDFPRTIVFANVEIEPSGHRRFAARNRSKLFSAFVSGTPERSASRAKFIAPTSSQSRRKASSGDSFFLSVESLKVGR